MRRFLAIVALACAVLAAPGGAVAQPNPTDIDPESLDDLSQALQFLGNEYASLYVQPVTDAFGSGMNAGLFRTAEVSGGIIPGVKIYAGVMISGALMGSSQSSFIPPQGEIITAPDGRELRISIEGIDRVPAAFGDTETPEGQLVVTDVATGQEIVRSGDLLPPGLVDTPVAPLIMPQIGIGSVFGTDVQLRYLPETRIKSYGTVGLFGLAVRHKVSRYLPASPVDISIQGSWNQLSLQNRSAVTSGTEALSDVLDASGWALNAHVSKTLPLLPVTFYGGLQYESFSVEYSYVFDPDAAGFGGTDQIEPIPVTLSQDATNQFRGIAGVSLTMAIINFNIDYALSANDAVTVGLGLKL